MGTRRSRHNYGRKPLYKEHRANLIGEAPEQYNRHACRRCRLECVGSLCRACYQRNSQFLHSERAKSLDPGAIKLLSEDAALHLFRQIRWEETDGQPVCPDCDGRVCYERRTRMLWQCKACSREFSALAGTPFESSKKGYVGVLLAVASFAQGDGHLATLRRAEECSLTPKAAVCLEKRIRVFAQPAEESFVLGIPRYNGFGWLSTRTYWSDAEKDALRRFAAVNAKPEACADTLGRSPTSILHYARELHIKFPPEWGGRKPRIVKPKAEPRIELQYPYVLKPRDRHADLLEVNALVPKGIPSHMRADICQEVMLALFEGRVTIDDIRRQKDKMRWFVTKFYRDNFEAGGHAVSLTGGEDEDRSYDEVASSIAVREHGWEQLNNTRRAHDAISFSFSPPTQIEDTYYSQISFTQRSFHEAGETLSYDEAQAALESGEVKSSADIHLAHVKQRALERHGLRLSDSDVRALEKTIAEGLAKRVYTDGSGSGYLVPTRGGQSILAVQDRRTRRITTVLPNPNEAP